MWIVKFYQPHVELYMNC